MIPAFAILILSVITSQYIMLGAIKQLGDEEKVKLMSARQIGRAQLRSIIMIAIAVVYYFALTSFPGYAYYFLAAFIIFLAAERIFSFTTTRKRLRNLGVPPFYIKKFTSAYIVSSTGLLMFFVLLLKDLF